MKNILIKGLVKVNLKGVLNSSCYLIIYNVCILCHINLKLQFFFIGNFFSFFCCCCFSAAAANIFNQFVAVASKWVKSWCLYATFDGNVALIFVCLYLLHTTYIEVAFFKRSKKTEGGLAYLLPLFVVVMALYRL